MKSASRGGVEGGSLLAGVFGRDACPPAPGASSDRLRSHPPQEERDPAYSWVVDHLCRIEGKEERNAYYGWLEWEGRGIAKPAS